jgi:hypothetical protein
MMQNWVMPRLVSWYKVLECHMRGVAWGVRILIKKQITESVSKP